MNKGINNYPLLVYLFGISLKFRLDQRSYDKPNYSSMYPIMKSIASLLSRKLNIYKINQQ